VATSIAVHTGLALTPTEALVAGYQIPSGTIMPYAGSTAPAGWLVCDGTSYVRTNYQKLFNAVGTAHGAADGTHFNVPDLRGMFVRGKDGGAGNDPDAAGRTAPRTGAATGDNVGSLQTDELKSHSHTINAGNVVGDLTAANIPYNTVYAQSGVVQPTGGNETRPKNITMLYVIKY
jgi:microcystin-dependent protein